MPIAKLRPTFTLAEDRLTTLRTLLPEAFRDGGLDPATLLDILGAPLNEEDQPGRDEHRYWTYFEDFGLDEEQEMWRAANLEAAATVEDLTADFD